MANENALAIEAALSSALREVMGESMGDKTWSGNDLAEAIARQGLSVSEAARAAASRVRRAYGGKFDDIPNARSALYDILAASE